MCLENLRLSQANLLFFFSIVILQKTVASNIGFFKIKENLSRESCWKALERLGTEGALDAESELAAERLLFM